MSTNGFAKRRDKNEPLIIAVFEAMGAVVQQLSEKGVPDLLVGRQGRNVLVEVKAPKGKLTPDQAKWLDAWKGEPVWVVRTPEEAVIALGARPHATPAARAGIWTLCSRPFDHDDACDGTRAMCPYAKSHQRGTYPRLNER